jgi:sugar/nucleoside kinase (ribokinase family)
MVVILGDLLADYSLHVPNLVSQPKDLHEVAYLELGPGGATNVAITIARFGLAVGCLGEVGDDLFGRVVIEGLEREGVDVSGVQVTVGARTPVANVLVDSRGEPTYLGFPGSLLLAHVLPQWLEPLQSADALYFDGWAEHEGAPSLLTEAAAIAREAGVPIFFDPGPGNPRFDNNWHRSMVANSTVFIATEEEARHIIDEGDTVLMAQALLASGPELVVIKRGVAGNMLFTRNAMEIAPGFPVALLDATGAGDSFAGAVIYGYLQDLDLPNLGMLANATGAAKVKKLGTGHNMPTIAEVRAVLERFTHPGSDFQLG